MGRDLQENAAVSLNDGLLGLMKGCQGNPHLLKDKHQGLDSNLELMVFALEVTDLAFNWRAEEEMVIHVVRADVYAEFVV